MNPLMLIVASMRCNLDNFRYLEKIIELSNILMHNSDKEKEQNAKKLCT